MAGGLIIGLYQQRIRCAIEKPGGFLWRVAMMLFKPLRLPMGTASGILADVAIPAIFRISMPKLKTHKGAAKRFKKTATGKVLRGQTKMRHILTSKEKKTKRHLGGTVLVSEADRPKVLRMIPYA
jgi:large subunit ribosomal protein L35